MSQQKLSVMFNLSEMLCLRKMNGGRLQHNSVMLNKHEQNAMEFGEECQV